ncbi:ATP-binding protein [Novosphingobium soli]|uniref:histidine kinase n=1 Tax=Novosphingobium soli TaxID=574956 RepID=A0ABV6CV25_9SPHN
MIPPPLPRRLGMPLAMQLIAVLVCVLLAAQLVTLALTVLLPPQPTARWNMDEVAAALAGDGALDRLERKTMLGPPDVSGQGWLVSESSREALARRLHRPAEDIVLAFYTQLPVGGVAAPAGARSPLAAETRGTMGLGSLLVETAQAQAIPGGPPPGGRPGPAGMPGGGFPGGRMPGGSFPGGGMPAGRPPSQPSTAMPRPSQPQGGAVGSARPGGGPVPATGQDRPGGPAPSGQPGSGSGGRGAPEGPGVARAGALQGAGPGGLSVLPAIPAPVPAIVPPRPVDDVETVERTPRSPAMPTNAPAQPPASVPSLAAAAPLPAPTAARAPQAVSAPRATPQPIPFRRSARSVFAMASPPFIEGDFVAAARRADGSWVAVAPRAEPFPNAWQRRVMLWFALSLAIVSPLAWLFARRIVVPLRDFARAAEQLGRDPSATILPLSGPAEIGRAANAFNQMRHRLRAFVDDRTAMVGAISHDLRTPLTRLRFRIEDVPDDQREGLLKEVTEMEAMISQVIAFIRDASTPGPRERLDFADLVAGSVADWRLVGADVEIERNLHIPVEVDPVGIRRLLGNLLENAVKYGRSAKVRVSLVAGEAVAEIVDAGPGIPEEEFDRAFEPFYRSETARRSGRTGSGLGLAVCRSIARAHGGDVSFAHDDAGFVARFAVPAAFDPTLRQAA